MGTKQYELTESDWNRIKDLLPPEHPKEGKCGRPAKSDNRTALNGMLWIARGGAPWRELPERYGPWQTVYTRFRNWRDMGIFEGIFQVLSIDADFENISIDSTSCKVHQSANGGEKSENKAVGMSRGGRNTKIRYGVEFCVSEIRQSQERHCRNRAEFGYDPLLSAPPGKLLQEDQPTALSANMI